MRAFHAAAIRPSVPRSWPLATATTTDIVRMANDAFGDWSDGGGVGRLGGRRATAICAAQHRPPSEGSAVGTADRAGRGGARYARLPRADVANTILGGQFVSRINLNLREDKGFTYGARTTFEFRRLPGPFLLQVSVQTAATARAIEESIREIAGIRGPRPVTPEELELAAAALTRGYARNFETAEQIARAVMQLVLFDLPDDYFAQFVPMVSRVTADRRVSA